MEAWNVWALMESETRRGYMDFYLPIYMPNTLGFTSYLKSLVIEIPREN